MPCRPEDQESLIDEAEIRRALSNGEFYYVYQPKVAIATNRICGAEALLRWNRKGKTVYPDAFLPLAERSSLITDITNAMLPALIKDVQIIEGVAPGLTTAFNACAGDFTEGHMVETIVEAIADGKLKRDNIRIEVTERTLAGNIEKLEARFQVLLDAGARLAMDDLGKGHSSLDLLSKLPFTCLKIDRGIVGKIGASKKAWHIVESICGLAKKLGITLIAEGVETQEVYAELVRLGCDQAQGYWISKPLPFSEFLDFVRGSGSRGIAPAQAASRRNREVGLHFAPA